jgi:fused signal recognition particle receptor
MFGLFKKNTPPAPPTHESAPTFLGRLREGLRNTGSRLSGLLTGRKIDEALFEELESALLSADAGVDATAQLITRLRDQARKQGLQTAEELKAALHSHLVEMLKPLEQPELLAEATDGAERPRPFVIMLAGVNGAGKTTSIGKLAKLFQSRGLSVLLAAGDTFRAAAREQLAAWGERNNVAVISQSGGTQSADPAAVIFDAIQAARARGIDIVLADTAGRLPTQLHLMEEVKKIRRVIAKADAAAPHEVLLVLDANTGQNAVSQLRAFDDAIGVTGVILTKLDGTAKGGVLAAIAQTRSGAKDTKPLALRYIGIGEGLDDLRAFSAEDFVSALLD